MGTTDIIGIVKTDFPWLDDVTAERLVQRAKYFFYALKYPFDSEADENKYPIVSFKDTNWVVEACNDLAQRLGIDSAVGYRENGMNISFETSKLSYTLIKLLVPVAGVIK